jgi:hypothetical protein
MKLVNNGNLYGKLNNTLAGKDSVKTEKRINLPNNNFIEVTQVFKKYPTKRIEHSTFVRRFAYNPATGQHDLVQVDSFSQKVANSKLNEKTGQPKSLRVEDTTKESYNATKRFYTELKNSLCTSTGFADKYKETNRWDRFGLNTRFFKKQMYDNAGRLLAMGMAKEVETPHLNKEGILRYVQKKIKTYTKNLTPVYPHKSMHRIEFKKAHEAYEVIDSGAPDIRFLSIGYWLAARPDFSEFPIERPHLKPVNDSFVVTKERYATKPVSDG